MANVLYYGQCRCGFNADELLRMGILQVYATPFDTSHQEFLDNKRILNNLDILRSKTSW